MNRKRILSWIGLASALLASVAAGPAVAQTARNAPQAGQHQGEQAGRLPTNVVYVESNLTKTGQNAVLAYRRDREGRLTELPGSPFLTGGTGFFDPSFKLGPFDSDQSVIIDRARHRLFAVNSGSNTIAVFSIRSDGSLRAITGSPFASGGINPVGVGVKGGYLVVVNNDGDPAQSASAGTPNYNLLRIHSNGWLSQVPGATVELPEGSFPTQPLTTNTGPFVFGAEFPVSGKLDVLALTRRDGLRLLDSVAVPPHPGAQTPQSLAPLGLWAHPKRPLLYVGLVAANQLAVERWDRFGRLHFIRAVPNSGAAICWIRTNSQGDRLYTADTGSNAISVYDNRYPTAPLEIQNLPLKGPGSTFQITLDSRELFFYAVNQRASADAPAAGNSLHVLKLRLDGRLDEAPGSPLVLPVPKDTRPQGVAAL